jgi:hypothetical protein
VSTDGRLCLANTSSGLEPLTITPTAGILPGSMLRLFVALLPTLLSAMRSRRHLVIENLALRQQLVILAGRRHPDIRPANRVFWILLRRIWSGPEARPVARLTGCADADALVASAEAEYRSGEGRRAPSNRLRPALHVRGTFPFTI